MELEQEIHGICDLEIQSGERVFCLVAEKVRQENCGGMNAQFNISSGVATIIYEFFFFLFFLNKKILRIILTLRTLIQTLVKNTKCD